MAKILDGVGRCFSESRRFAPVTALLVSADVFLCGQQR